MMCKICHYNRHALFVAKAAIVVVIAPIYLRHVNKANFDCPLDHN